MASRQTKSGVTIDLSGRVALVTGGSRGVGAATVRTLAAAGADVAVNYRAKARVARAVAEAAAAHGAQALTVQADVADPGAVKRMVRQVLQEFGRIDILVNNAGVWDPEPVGIETLSPKRWQRTLDVNLNGCYHASHAVTDHMKARGSGRIVNVASTAAQRGESFHAHYAASKGAIIALTKSLAGELAPHGVLVNCVAPGWIQTDMVTPITPAERRAALKTIPLRRFADPSEIAGAILFLASDLASYCCGEALNVNGGSVLCG